MVDPARPRASGTGRVRLIAAAVLVVTAIVAAVAVAVTSPSKPRSLDGAANASAGSSAAPAASASTFVPGPSAGGTARSATPVTLAGGTPRVGWIATVDGAGVLSLVAPDGRALALSGPDETSIGFPAFSPDGGRLAAVLGSNGATTIDVFTIDRDAVTVAPPVPIYRSSSQAAFYLSWAPGGRDVSFLANDADLVALRIAAADRASPLDDTDSASLIRRGAPLYFDWIDDQEALVHVGVGEGAFLARLRRDGTEDGGALARPGDFRSAQVSASGESVGWIRSSIAGGGAGSEVVLASRDGTAEWTLPVFGPAAVVFSPTEDRLAAIGADVAGESDLAFPLGPLRTIEARSGETRTLLDGAVVASFWSPDGRTIAALRLQVPSGTTALAPGGVGAASPSPVPSEVHLLFVDVATSAVRSDRVVRPGARLVSEVLPYFDQYELSHRLWAPDGSSFLLPIVSDAGEDETVAFQPDGGDSLFSIAAPAAFWSP